MGLVRVRKTLERVEPRNDAVHTVSTERVRLREEIPLLDAQKFVKLNDRILVVDPASRVVVAMIPRYRLLP